MARNIGENNENMNMDANTPDVDATVVEDDSIESVLAKYTDDTPAQDAPAPEAEKEESAKEPKKKKEKKQRTPMKKGMKIAVSVVVIAVVALAGTFAFLYLDNNRILAADEETAIRDNGTIYQGVSVLGVDLSGLTMDEARPLVQQAADAELDGIGISYMVDDAEYTLLKDELGATVDVESAVNAAILYGRQGTFFERMEQIEAAEQNGAPIDLPISYDEQKILQALESNKGNMDVDAVDASVEMQKVSDESNKITDMEITYTDHVVGYGVDREALASEIYAAVGAGNFETLQVERNEIQPGITNEDIQGLYAERGVFSTKYSSSAEGRRYNIWKMSDIINGVKIEPGEEWSINEEAGPRTYSLGWKGAPGINNGEYKEEAGGGICQVSSTLYNAVIRAEVEIVDRSHHSWPLDYVDGGLDATISTGAPDFVIKNNYDVPIYIIARCNGEGDKTVEVAIYGPARDDDYTIDFRSELISTWGGGGTVTVNDPSMPQGTTRQIIGAHPGKKYDVYKQWKDAAGNVVKEELYYTDVYDPKPAKVAVGTGAPAVVEQPAPPTTPDPAPPTTPDPAPPTTPDPAPPTTPDPGTDGGGEPTP